MTKYKIKDGSPCYEYPNCNCTHHFIVEKNKKKKEITKDDN